MSVKVFISYAHDDQELHEQLRNHLSPLERLEKITIWHDQKILPGEDWEHQINAHLNEADLILLLVSADFIKSNYCWNQEVRKALQRHKAGTAKVVPVILRPTAWNQTPLARIQALPANGKPVTEWHTVDAAFEDVARGIGKVVDDLLGTSETTSWPRASHITTEDVTPPALSSRSRLYTRPLPSKKFTIKQLSQHKWVMRGGSIALVMVLLSSFIWVFYEQRHRIGVITEYPIPTEDVHADDITQGPDRNLWFVEDNMAKIGRMTPQGQVTEFSLTPKSNPSVIVSGPDGKLWVLENGINKIARVTPRGQVTEFPTAPGSNLVGLAAGKDGNLWFTEFQTNKIGRMDISGRITGEFSLPNSNSGAAWITQGPDGNLWFDEQRGNRIGSITSDGHITECPYVEQPVPGTDNNHNLVAGPDGNVWFTDFWHNVIGSITPKSCHITEYLIPTPNAVPVGITVGPDKNIWFTECVPNAKAGCESSKIGRLNLQGQMKMNEYPLEREGIVLPVLSGITSGPDGNVWFSEDSGNQIGRITTGL